ncbi:MAG: hypothetical protein KAJ40_05535 [Alphaproteobacteria bacterium]|nr:hypothetical protein [Alphaproteobacteria bacterium]
MLDFGWPELFVIIALVVLFAGPQDLPRVMVALGRITRRLQYVRYAISRQFDDVMREADLDNIRKSVNFEEQDKHGQPVEFDEATADEEYAALGGAYADIPASVDEEELPEDTKGAEGKDHA